MQAEGVEGQGERDEKAVQDGAENDGKRGNNETARGQQVLTNNDGGKTNDDGANAHGNIRAALTLRKQRTRQRDQRVGERQTRHHQPAGGNPLRARHARVGTSGTHGQANAGGEKGVQQ